jgi:hypothetical protein
VDRRKVLNSRGFEWIGRDVRCEIFVCPRLPFLPEIEDAPQSTQREMSEIEGIAGGAAWQLIPI